MKVQFEAKQVNVKITDREGKVIYQIETSEQRGSIDAVALLNEVKLLIKDVNSIG